MLKWFQFRLRSLLILMLVLAAYCGGWVSSRSKHERELQKALRNAEEAAANAMKSIAAELSGSQGRIVVLPSGSFITDSGAIGAPSSSLPGVTTEPAPVDVSYRGPVSRRPAPGTVTTYPLGTESHSVRIVTLPVAPRNSTKP